MMNTMTMMMMIKKLGPVNQPDKQSRNPNHSRKNPSKYSKNRARHMNLAVSAMTTRPMVLLISGTTTDATIRIVATIRTAISMIATTGGVTVKIEAKAKVAITSVQKTLVEIDPKLVTSSGRDANLVLHRNRLMRTQTTGYTTATTRNSSSR